MMRRTDRNRAASMAYEVLKAQGVKRLPVDPLALLRGCRNTEVCTYTQAAERLGMTDAAFERTFGVAEAFTIAQGDRFITCYRAEGNPARLRFTLAHELGHRVLGHQAQDQASERAADVFASHLLCPRPVLARLMESGVCAEELARIFYVSGRCMREILTRRDDQLPTELWHEVAGRMLTAEENPHHACPKDERCMQNGAE